MHGHRKIDSTGVTQHGSSDIFPFWGASFGDAWGVKKKTPNDINIFHQNQVSLKNKYQTPINGSTPMSAQTETRVKKKRIKIQ